MIGMERYMDIWTGLAQLRPLTNQIWEDQMKFLPNHITSYSSESSNHVQ